MPHSPRSVDHSLTGRSRLTQGQETGGPQRLDGLVDGVAGAASRFGYPLVAREAEQRLQDGGISSSSACR
jgi:hypothetical protein